MNQTEQKYGIVIVDMQARSFSAVKEQEIIKAAVPAQLALIQSGIDREIPVIFLEYWMDGWQETLPELLTACPNQERVVIKKNKFCGFEGTAHYGPRACCQGQYTCVSLDSYLKSRDVTEVMVGGWHVMDCVAETIISGMKLGYVMHTAVDLVAPASLARSAGHWRKLLIENWPRSEEILERKLHTYDTVYNLLGATIW